MLSLSPFEYAALALSLKVAIVAVVVSLPFALVIAWLLARREFKGKALFEAIVHLPLVLPPVAVGYLLLMTFGRNGWLGEKLLAWFGVSFAFSWQGAALAAAIVSLPLSVRAIRQAIESVDRKLEAAASTLGASPLRVFFTITLPLTLPGILAGSVLAFARSLGEFGATISFVANIPGETQTIPLAMYTLLETPGAEQSAARLCALAILLSVAALVVSGWLNKKVVKTHG